jgi:tRNA G18 (ribose-2'-O)-methylase SpoU
MPRIAIAELDDPRIAVYRNLKATNLTRGRPEFVVEGPKLVARLFDSPFPLASVLVADRREDEVSAWLPADVPLFVVPHALLDGLVGFNFHQGVLGCGVRRDWPPLDAIVQRAGARLTLVLCPMLNNPENLGAIIRIADVFGIDAILAGGRCPDPLSRRVVRVSMGTALHLPVLASSDLARDAERLRTIWGVELVAAVAEPGAEPLDTFVRRNRTAIVLGSEHDGVSGDWLARSDRRVTIPMRAGAESLNVAVAAGILLFGLTRGPGPA